MKTRYSLKEGSELVAILMLGRVGANLEGWEKEKIARPDWVKDTFPSGDLDRAFEGVVYSDQMSPKLYATVHFADNWPFDRWPNFRRACFQAVEEKMGEYRAYELSPGNVVGNIARGARYVETCRMVKGIVASMGAPE